MKKIFLGQALAVLATQAWAQNLAKFCPSDDICYQLNIPQSTASSGSGEIFFQISGPTSYSWIGLGQGSGMSGANIFVMYADGNGNVTVSPRLGQGHVEPEHDTNANIAVLEGSGISNGRMVANVRCDNCDSWQGGSMDFSSSSGGWIFASCSGDPLESTSLSAEIDEHQAHGTFTWDFSDAQGGDSVNPFVASDNAGGVSSTPDSSDGGSDGNSASTVSATFTGPSDTMITAHGTLASIAFLALFPGGAIFIRIPALSRFGGAWMHGTIQIFAYCIFIAAAGLGIYIASAEDYLMEYHPIIGMVLLGVLFFQPFGGILHHHFYKKHGRRTLTSYLHIFLGRGAILLGILNGGFGLILSGVTNMGYLAAYGVVAGVMGSAYLAAIIYGEVDRSKRSKSQASSRDGSNRGVEMSRG